MIGPEQESLVSARLDILKRWARCLDRWHAPTLVGPPSTGKLPPLIRRPPCRAADRRPLDPQESVHPDAPFPRSIAMCLKTINKMYPLMLRRLSLARRRTSSASFLEQHIKRAVRSPIALQPSCGVGHRCLEGSVAVAQQHAHRQRSPVWV